MVERIARRFRADDGNPCISPSRNLCRNNDGCVCRSLARAAIEAMREPTSFMVDVGVAIALNVTLGGDYKWRAYIADKHRAMIDAALADGEAVVPRPPQRPAKSLG